MISERRLLNRKRRAVKYHVPSESLCRLSGVDGTGRDRDDGTGWICQEQCCSESEAGPAERDRCVARLITYLRLHYCKQCISLYVRSLLPFVLSCLPTYLPIYPTPVYLVPSFISQSYTPRKPFHCVKLFVPLKATLSLRCILKRLDARIYPLRVSMRPPICDILQLDPRRWPCFNKY